MLESKRPSCLESRVGRCCPELVALLVCGQRCEAAVWRTESTQAPDSQGAICSRSQSTIRWEGQESIWDGRPLGPEGRTGTYEGPSIETRV